MANGPPTDIVDVMPSFAGGLNEVADDFGFTPDQYGVGENIVATRTGEIARRNGTRLVAAGTVGGVAQPINGGFCWRQATTHVYMAVTNGHLYTAPAYALPFVWTDRGAIGSSSTYPSFAAFRDGTGEVVYFADGVALRKVSAALVLSTPAGTPANLAQVAVYNQRLFGITGSDQTIYYSSLNNGDSCGVVSATSGSAIVRTFGSQRLTALCALQNSLAMFHVTGISRFTGLTQDDIAIGAGSEGLSVDTGTIVPRSIVAVEGAAYFLCERGAFKLTDTGIESLDLPMRPDNTRLELAGLMGGGFAPIICGVHDRARHCIRWFDFSGVISYDYRRQVWVGRDRGAAFDNVRAMWDGLGASSEPIVLTGTSGGAVYLTDDPTSYRDGMASDGTGGAAFQMYVTTRRFWGPNPSHQKSWAMVHWFGRFSDDPGTINATVNWTTNLAAGTRTGLTKPVALFDQSSILSVPIGQLGHWVDVEFVDTSETDVRLCRVEVEAFDYGRRRA